MEDITPLLAKLTTAATFEDAAVVTLDAMLSLAAEALSSSELASSGRILRGMAHLRPADGYRRLCIREHGGDTSPASLPSATAWRWVAEHRSPVAIDVTAGLVDVGARGERGSALRSGSGFDSQESRTRLLKREATHMLALPLRAPGGVVDGMLSIEAHCRAAIGEDFIFPACRDRLQLLAAVASPYLCALPPRPAAAAPPDEHLPVIGSSMATLVEMLRVFAQQEETLLLSGPTGAGKSRLARWCHAQSARRDLAFETLDLSTVPEDLQMAELFGWKRGAFTGALKDMPGAIARAGHGTLFIDEVDKLSLKAQAGLLRVIEERKYRPLGEASGDRGAPIRFIVGTNADLSAAVRAGRFREDLYYRVNVLPVKIPPLSERRDEIPAWAAYMLGRRSESIDRARRAVFAADAERTLCMQPWPGNLRQLDNIVRRACALALMRAEPASDELRIEARDVEQALAYESSASPQSLFDLFQATAAAFVAEAERRSAGGGALDLDLTAALRGFVLGTAVLKLGDKEEAFRLLGKAALTQNRNHHKALRRELDTVEALRLALGRSDNPFASIVDAEKSPRP